MHSIAQLPRLAENLSYNVLRDFRPAWAITTALTVINSAFLSRQTTSIALSRRLHLIQGVSSFFDIAALAINCGQLAQVYYGPPLVEERMLSAFFPTLRGFYSFYLPTMLLVAATSVASLYASRKRQGLIHPEKISQSSIELSFDSPWWQITAQSLLVARIATTLCLAYFSPESRLFCGFNTGCLIYNFFKTRQVKWLTLIRKYVYPPTEHTNSQAFSPSRIIFHQTFPLFENPDPGEGCMFCPTRPASFSLCYPHATFCDPDTSDPGTLSCLEYYLHNQVENVDKLFLPQITDGILSASYPPNREAILQFNLKEKDQIHCPGGCCQPLYNLTAGIEYHDQHKSSAEFHPIIHWEKDPNQPASTLPLLSSEFLKKLKILSSLFQSGLAIMRARHPELSTFASSSLLTGLCGVFDLGFLIKDCATSFQTLYEKLYQSNVVKKTEQLDKIQAKKKKIEDVRAKCNEIAQTIFDLQEELQQETINGHLLQSQNLCIALNAKGQQILENWDGKVITEEFKNALAAGEIIPRRLPLPLRPDLIESAEKFGSLFHSRRIQRHRNNETISYTPADTTDKEVVEFLKTFEEERLSGGFGQVDPLTNCLALTPEGEKILTKLHMMLKQGPFQINPIKRGFIPRNEEDRKLLSQFKKALLDMEIIDLHDEDSIPITPKARDALKYLPRFEAKHELEQRALAAAEAKGRVLQTLLEEKYKSSFHISLLKKAAIGGIALAAGAFIVPSLLYKWLRPVDLTEILKQGIPPADCELMHAHWVFPWPQYLLGCLYAAQAATNLALVFFSSSSRKTFAFSALCQSFSLWKLCQSHWIQLDRMLSVPELGLARMSFQVLVPGFDAAQEGCASLSSHFGSQMRSICDYTANTFSKSKKIEPFFGSINGSLLYKVLPHARLITTAHCKSAAAIQNIWGLITNIYGSVSLNFLLLNHSIDAVNN